MDKRNRCGNQRLFLLGREVVEEPLDCRFMGTKSSGIETEFFGIDRCHERFDGLNDNVSRRDEIGSSDQVGSFLDATDKRKRCSFGLPRTHLGEYRGQILFACRVAGEDEECVESIDECIPAETEFVFGREGGKNDALSVFFKCSDRKSERR